MNRYIRTVLFSSLILICAGNKAEMLDSKQELPSNPLIAAVVNQVNKVSKKPVHKYPVEYRDAVERYMTASKTHCAVLSNKIDKGKALSYEKELHYLFNNYKKFSTPAPLLSRLRSAHQEMMKGYSDAHSERYEHHEQVCSALLLQCAQILADNARKQLLDALQEVDDLIDYWHYQKNHSARYFFGKSPHKWIMGKSQEKEVNDNIKKLERKQAELYTILGKLTAHAHSFTECSKIYTSCYAWIEELFVVLSCITTTSVKVSDESLFDHIAAQLELKIKQVGNLQYQSLYSISSTQKSNHFVRNWIPYTAALAATGYAAHYHLNHAGVMFAAYMATQEQAVGFLNLLVGPLHKVYDRGKIAFSYDEKAVTVNDNQKIDASSQAAVSVDENKIDINIDELLEKIEKLGTEVPASIAKELAKSNTSLLQDAENGLDKVFDALEQAGIKRGCILNSYTIDRVGIKKALFGDGTAEFPGGDFGPLEKLYDTLESLGWAAGWVANGDAKLSIKGYGSLVTIVKDYLDPLEKYADIIDDKILNLIDLIVKLVVKLGKDSDDLLKEAEDQLKQANATMEDHRLTLMFTTLIPLAGTSYLAAKIHQWAMTRNYPSIRIALADVNSLLIESPMPLDDYDYGKLVYLVHKLRNKASSLKDGLCNEFLADITKLESKRFDVAAKRGIVDNMFNKYAFLGRITA